MGEPGRSWPTLAAGAASTFSLHYESGSCGWRTTFLWLGRLTSSTAVLPIRPHSTTVRYDRCETVLRPLGRDSSCPRAAPGAGHSPGANALTPLVGETPSRGHWPPSCMSSQPQYSARHPCIMSSTSGPYQLGCGLGGELPPVSACFQL
jgi:hypothetical protein